MRKIVLLFGLLLALSLPAMAQDQPRFDVFGGYSYIRFNDHVSTSSGSLDFHSNLNGGSGSVAFYPSSRWGVVGDFGGYKISSLSGSAISAASGGTANSVDVSGTVFSYLFGPRIRFGSGGMTPFAQVLFGGAHAGEITTSNSAACGGSPPCTLTKSDNAFALTAGGGVDFKVSRHFAVRGQAEYLMTRFKDIGSSTGARIAQHNARISAGIVIR